MIIRSVILLLVFSASVFCNPKRNLHEEFPCRLGDKEIKLQRIHFDGSNCFFVAHLHDDERTAAKISSEFLEKNGGAFFTIKNENERLIDFPLQGKNYRFDPNRIFTEAGRIGTLEGDSTNKQEAALQLHSFADKILSLLPADSLIAVHNNTEGAYSILSYTPGGKYAGDAAAVYVNDKQDADDFFLTTDSLLFNRLKEQNFNVILQNNSSANDDGSLSIYYGRAGKFYVNVEAQHGHEAVQLQMLKAVAETLKKN